MDQCGDCNSIKKKSETFPGSENAQHILLSILFPPFQWPLCALPGPLVEKVSPRDWLDGPGQGRTTSGAVPHTDSIIIQGTWSPGCTLKHYVHLIIFQSVPLVKFITFHRNKYLSKYNIRMAFEDPYVFSNNDFTSFSLWRRADVFLWGCPPWSWACWLVTEW